MKNTDNIEEAKSSSNLTGYVIAILAAFIYECYLYGESDLISIIATMIGALIIPLIFAALISLGWGAKYWKVFPWVFAITSISLFILSGIGNGLS